MVEQSFSNTEPLPMPPRLVHDYQAAIGKFTNLANQFLRATTLTDSERAYFSDIARGVITNPIYLQGNCRDVDYWLRHTGGGGRLLDIGCGSGYITTLFAEHATQVNAIETDGSGSQWEVHRANTHWSGFRKLFDHLNRQYTNLAFDTYTGTNIPFAENAFDHVVAYAVIEHVHRDQEEKLLREMYRVLKPGGYLYITKLPRTWSIHERLARWLGFDAHLNLYSRRQIVGLLTTAGFTNITIQREDISFVNYGPLTKLLSPLSIWVNDHLNFFPLNLFAHNYRLLARKP